MEFTGLATDVQRDVSGIGGQRLYPRPEKSCEKQGVRPTDTLSQSLHLCVEHFCLINENSSASSPSVTLEALMQSHSQEGTVRKDSVFAWYKGDSERALVIRYNRFSMV